MAYIGKSPQGSGVRTRYYFTQTSGGATSISGTDDNGKTLSYTDGEYVDVYLNGVLLVHGTDYGTGTANTISSLAALANGDVVEVVVYDVYNVAKINSEAMRNRYYFTATGGETSIGTSQISNLVFPANAEIDVKLNGVTLQAGTDYNTTSANTVGGLSALTAGQVVEIVYYEKFVLGDTVSKASGGTFANPIVIDGDGATVLTVDRATSEGTIIDVQKDGTSKGTIGVSSNSLFTGTTDTGLLFYDAGDAILPFNPPGSTRDNAIDLGRSSDRFKDLYLSGNLYLGGTGSANALDDYEEGTWTPVMSGSTTAGTMTGNANGRYRKIGSLVYTELRFDNVTLSGAAGAIKITGLPFNTTYGSNNVYSAATATQMYGITFSTAHRQSFYPTANNTVLFGLESRSGDTWVDWSVTNGSNLYMNLVFVYITN
jgi:hypothetical protein